MSSGEKGDTSKLPEVTVRDTSKYGVSVNGTKLESGGSCQLANGDVILFGTHNSSYRLSYIQTVFATSCLDTNKKKILKKQIHKLGGHLLSEWRRDCTTHLVMEGLTFTVKVIQALASCCPIVTPEFVDEMIKSSEENRPLQDYRNYLPPIKEETIKSDGEKFLPNPDRKSLFSGKNFVFLSKKQYKRTFEAVEQCGGRTSLYESADCLVDSENLVASNCCVMMVDAKERESLAPATRQFIGQAMDVLKRHRMRPIPESELGLAILQVSLSTYCNPNMEAVPLLTQNLVCQSLQIGPEEISQVFSQHRATDDQFKKPIMPWKGNSNKLGFAKTEPKTSVMETVLETQTQTSPVDKKPTGIIAETQRDSQAPHTTVHQTSTSPGKDKSTMDTTPVKHALVSDTPLNETLHWKKRPTIKASPIAETQFDTSRSVFHAQSMENSQHHFQQASNKSPELDPSKPKNTSDDIKFAVPESMEFECDSSVREHGGKGSSLLSESNVESVSEWKTAKRARLESNGSLTEDMNPCKRNRNEEASKNGFQEENLPRQTASVKELPSTFVHKRTRRSDYKSEITSQLSRQSDDDNETPQAETTIDSRPSIVNGTSCQLPDGFLSARLPRQLSLKQGDEEDEEDASPLRNLVIVEEASLVVRRPREPGQAIPSADGNTRNFKKFKKQWYPGRDSVLPRLIGGSDLAVFESQTGVEQELWFAEAREVDAEQERLDRQAEQMFLMETEKKTRKKR
ncbi:nibrin isoform X2 [Nematostella vectensis]|uniref:nibrin isoform X2 n=1 Tax=Nematostella vectensis TaxID=45351 RepID=UPI0020775559|nr:nibrin isoform X2 [Nematostella vectensis]